MSASALILCPAESRQVKSCPSCESSCQESPNLLAQDRPFAAVLSAMGSCSVQFAMFTFRSPCAQELQRRGGVQYIVPSHPHFYSSMVDWARALDATILIHEVLPLPSLPSLRAWLHASLPNCAVLRSVRWLMPRQAAADERLYAPV